MKRFQLKQDVSIMFNGGGSSAMGYPVTAKKGAAVQVIPDGSGKPCYALTTGKVDPKFASLYAHDGKYYHVWVSPDAVEEFLTSRQKEAREFAERIKAMGFVVYLAESGEYGFITNENESRVLCFGFSGVSTRLSGCYGPPSTTSGTGWGMDQGPEDLLNADDVKRALYAHPPAWAGNGWKYLTTVKQHLAQYSSSRYERF